MESELVEDVHRLAGALDETVRERSGERALTLLRLFRDSAVALREGRLAGGRDAFAAKLGALSVEELGFLARTFTLQFHLFNAAEEQHRTRTLRRREGGGAPPSGSIAAALEELSSSGASAGEVRALLGRLLVMPVLTAHPSEARRGTVLDHLAELARALDRLDDPRVLGREREQAMEALRRTVLALDCTDEVRAARPTPLDEVAAGLHVFRRTLMDVTPRIYRELEDGLGERWPGEAWEVGPFLRWGTWIGGDRDGNPNVTAEVTRATFERQRASSIARLVEDALALGAELSMSQRRCGVPEELAASLALDEERLPEVAARMRRKKGAEPWREKLTFMRARLAGALTRAEGGYASASEYLADLALVRDSLARCGMGGLTRGRLRDAVRRAQVFGFHLATVDVRQHSAVHEEVVAELLARGGVRGYAGMAEEERVRALSGLLERADVGAPWERSSLSPAARELLETMDVLGRARRELGPDSCGRWIISFTRKSSDVLEVLFLARAARLALDEIRPVPLFEQLEDLEAAPARVEELLAIGPLRAALGGELEVMIGYSDSSKQVGYVASTVALHEAQEALAQVADRAGVVLTVFHGRGGAVGRGGGPAIRAIRAQPKEALRGRFRVTEQGETVAARYGRADIARRDLEQMVNGVLLRSLLPDVAEAKESRSARHGVLRRAAAAARARYEELVGDRERLVAYVTRATPIQEIAQLRLASRPAARRPGLTFEDLRAIPWVFSWNQSRHGVPGWFGLGTALEAIEREGGPGTGRRFYEEWPYFRALVDNAQLALARADIDVAEHYARLAGPGERGLFALIREEHARTIRRVLEAAGEEELLAGWPTIARTVERRNPYVDVLSHVQVELLRRLRAASAPGEQERIREALFVTISGIAAGLQTAG